MGRRALTACAVALSSFAHSQHSDDARWWAGFATQGPVGPGVVFAAAEFQGDYSIGGSFTLTTPDGVVDFIDLNIVLSFFGTNC